jgi:hypothetical protein
MSVPRRKRLPHQIPLWVDPQREIYFITINCQARGTNQLAKPDVARPLLASVRFRNEKFIWFAHLFLLMPDHIHALVSFPPSELGVGTPGPGVHGHVSDVSLSTASLGHLGEMSLPTNQIGTAGPSRPGSGRFSEASLPRNRAKTLQNVVTSWKRWTARELGIVWQRDFFEHRLRREESRREKADYILANPVRKNLAARPEDWPFVYFADGQHPQFEW